LDFAAPIVGLVVGVVVGLTSTGGGALLTPALVFILGVPAASAIGTDVFVAAVMKLFGGAAYARRGHVHYPTVLRLAAGSIPGAAAGLWLLRLLPPESLDEVLRRGLGVALLIAGGTTLARLLARSPQAPRTPLRLRLALPLGFLVGVLVATTSVGSGSLLMAVLAPLSPLGAPTLVGTDLVHALLLSGTATLGHVAAGRVDFPLAASLLAGAIPGVLLSARVAQAMPERALRTGLAVLLIGIGLLLVSGMTGHPRGKAPQAQEATA
jgi:hypothetical protein